MMRGTVHRSAMTSTSQEHGGDYDDKVPLLSDLMNARDWQGAVTMLQADPNFVDKQLWLAYCHFHSGSYDKALHLYEQLASQDNGHSVPQAMLYAAVCHFYMCNYDEARKVARKGPADPLQLRLLLHVANAKGDEEQVVQCRQQLSESVEDQLSLAAIHFRRGHFQEATDIYKRFLMEDKSMVALNIFIALCYSRLDYYDISQDILKQYMTKVQDSILARNLHACNTFRLQNGKAAENELQQFKTLLSTSILGNDLVKHNLVVFRGGENALRDLRHLLGIIPEARLNLVIHYMRKGEVDQAFDLIKDVEPAVPQEYILKAVTHAAKGQRSGDVEHIKTAQQYFQLVGASASECDTIPGRQCMASCFYLLRQFDDALMFLTSIQQYFKDDDDYNWNNGMALAETQSWADAEVVLLKIKNEEYRSSKAYAACLARCHIMNGKPDLAWDIFSCMQSTSRKSATQVLQLIANDCYGMGQFLVSAKAFQLLEKLEGGTRNYEGKRGACLGYFQQLLASDTAASRDQCHNVIEIMQNCTSGHSDALAIVEQLTECVAMHGLL